MLCCKEVAEKCKYNPGSNISTGDGALEEMLPIQKHLYVHFAYHDSLTRLSLLA